MSWQLDAWRRRRTTVYCLLTTDYLVPRLAVALLLVLLVGLPLLWPAGRLGEPSAWPTGETLHRIAVLNRNTALLVLLVELLAMPAGVLLAVLLVRTDLPGRGLFAFVLLLSLFVPLPLVTSGWQVVL